MSAWTRYLFRLGPCGALLVWSANVFGAPAAGPSRSDSHVNLAGDIYGTTFGFFDPVTGVRAATLHIGRVGREYGRQGLFHVAWKPQLILEHTLLQVDDAAIWPQAARQFWGTLPSCRIAGMIVIRDFRLRMGSQGGILLSCALACLSPEGNVELAHAVLTTPGRAPLVLANAFVPLTRPTPSVWIPAPASRVAPSHYRLFGSLPL